MEKASQQQSVATADDRMHVVKGRGNVHFLLTNDEINLKNVLYMLGLRQNLISAGQYVRRLAIMTKSMYFDNGSGFIAQIFSNFCMQNENKLKLCHLKTFGCLSYVHIRHQSRKKLQSRSIMESFVVYDKQTTALSSSQAKYRALAEVSREATWLSMLLKALQIKIKLPISIHCNNVGSISIATNLGVNPTTRYIAIHYYFIKEKSNLDKSIFNRCQLWSK
uniref:Retrovirus-related Pol polyprotein from transposon TNT 1-94-like beta-barrel domain-containing protein n=1 Tax=Physcomitrium patens TaxID=3218 RepID=A0A2K1KU04_PHYPA|nr:hypothetical protein PHYPA_004229 [Physcomitrium patens]